MSNELGGGASITTEPAAGSSTATDVSIRDYFLALRASDNRLREADQRCAQERDRRYTEVENMNDRRLTEVAIEREKALKIKETADLAALELAREIQAYKDEKANNLRTQIESERGTYATKNDLESALREINVTIRPLADFITALQGRASGIGSSLTFTNAVILLLIAVAGVYLALHR